MTAALIEIFARIKNGGRHTSGLLNTFARWDHSAKDVAQPFCYAPSRHISHKDKCFSKTAYDQYGCDACHFFDATEVPYRDVGRPTVPGAVQSKRRAIRPQGATDRPEAVA
jgi:hypothetical protein